MNFGTKRINMILFIFIISFFCLNNNFLSLINSQNLPSKTRTDLLHSNNNFQKINDEKEEKMINIGNDGEDKRNLIGKGFDATLDFGYQIYLNIRNYFIRILARSILFSKDVFFKMNEYLNILKNNAKDSAIKAVEITKIKAVEIDEWAKENSK